MSPPLWNAYCESVARTEQLRDKYGMRFNELYWSLGRMYREADSDDVRRELELDMSVLLDSMIVITIVRLGIALLLLALVALAFFWDLGAIEDAVFGESRVDFLTTNK